MLKKLSLLFAAFVLGAVISLAIQACGNESKIESGNDVTTGDVPSSGNDSDTPCNCAWGSQKWASIVSYDENGLESNRTDYEYDDAGRLIGSIQLVYSKSISGDIYLYYKQEIDYTYTDSDNIRFGTITTTQYDENGGITRKTKTTDKVILYKQ
ncbi:hypothetical protein [Alistipes sp. An66]|uniref:hypothetical protein n=1 Tax=Alistipes sp. An66 TaxID=1965650 RepID=UPI000B39E623|nr:hypothetical protein [Alistipes sp. An66]